MDVDVRVTNIPASDALEAHVRRRFSSGLGRLRSRVRRAAVRISDTNGPKGGEDMACAVELRLDNGGVLVLREQAHDPYSGISKLSRRTRQAIARVACRQKGRQG